MEIGKDIEVRLATGAIEETENTVRFLLFGEMTEKKIMPINEACPKCSFWKSKFADTKSCQAIQKEDSEARGFAKLVCPKQFIN